MAQCMMPPYVGKEMPLQWMLQEDNEPKHALKICKEQSMVNN